ncbi:Multiple stress resistance protein BhsA precursor [Sodalis glossinidius str. 'morsitans']|uniref:Multiple stress resistance protein BhsA n=1 Tax=Sodalis glossinidius (strain morsitans) TaxID=343509 RepID=Q2NTW2_SODGM|nr:YdgH/BhsA/McbA-like domain containing protein [Sodalis glossinidius]BAE74413.1 conserved hypothetical protein [Sodalis glossinidius str. 'morsitans']CRL45043.1 Multiple stress resistance protein BhsA precursor [Sodalis glossinidius str. 'morsitans']
MKRSLLFISSLLLASLSLPTFAAEPISRQEAVDKQALGTISITGAATLDHLEHNIAQKADQAGAKYYVIIATTGKNRLHGDALIYQ